MKVQRLPEKELGDLERALVRQWKCVCRLVTIEGPDALTGTDNLILVLGLAVGETLSRLKRFLKEGVTAKSTVPEKGAELLHCKNASRAEPTDATDEVAVKLALLESMETGVQKSAYMRA